MAPATSGCGWRSRVTSAAPTLRSPASKMRWNSRSKPAADPACSRLCSDSSALQESDFIAAYGQYAGAFAVKLIMFALILRGVGVFSSIIGIMAVRVPAGKMLDPMRPINIGYMTSAIASVIGFFVVNYFYLDDPRTRSTDWRFACCASLGIILAVVTLWLTNYFTHPDNVPVTETAMAARTGPATPILPGMGGGPEAAVWALLVIAAASFRGMVVFQLSAP